MEKLTCFSNAINANIAKGLLQNEGIDCTTGDDSLNQLYPGINVPLYVTAADKEKALHILRAADLI